MKNLLVRSFIIALVASLAAIFIAAQSVQAAPANPNSFPITQPDGTTFSARLWGDEWNNGIESAAGYTIIHDPASGYWVYATLSDSASLAPALANGHVLVAGKDEPVGLSRRIRPQPVQQNPNIAPLSSSAPQSKNSGTQKVLVLLVDFSDQAGTYSAGNFSALFFGATNSVKSYYEQASRANFSLSPASETSGTPDDGVIGWLNMGYPHINTGSTTNISNLKLVWDALGAADSYVDYSSFDTDHNGYISNSELHIVVIVAGYEASYDTSSPSVWGHRWYLQSSYPPRSLDGVVLGDGPHGGGYSQFGEKHGSYDNHIATIGIMAHELGHDISWPDLYDTATSNATEGVGEWSVMGSGSWNYVLGSPGNRPALPDAWLKWYQGWQTPIQVKGLSSGVTIDPNETVGNSYLLGENPNDVDWNFMVKSGVGEYFLVENRQLTGYDSGLPGCGLLIWHIDESRTYLNTANNGTHPLVFLEQADGLNHLMLFPPNSNRGDAGDTFPGSLNKTSFTNLTNPNSNLYSGSDSGARVTNITSTPPACSLVSPSSITATLVGSGLNLDLKVFAPAILTGAAPPPPPSKGIYGYVTYQGTALSGVELLLRFYNGAAWSTVATTTSASDGLYSFKNAAGLAAGQLYYVLYPNNENLATRLYYWGTKLITAYTTNQEVNIGNFDVADIPLGYPLNGTTTPFPVTFNWTPRTSSTTDSYYLEIYRDSDWLFSYESSALGYVSSTTLNSLPSGMSFGTVYGWFPAVVSPDGGYGESYYYKQITFSPPSSPSFSPPMALWMERTTLRAPETLVYHNEK